MLRLHVPNAGHLDLIPGQGTRSPMLQLRVRVPQLKMPQAKRKIEGPTCHNQDLLQPNKYVLKNEIKKLKLKEKKKQPTIKQKKKTTAERRLE